MKEKLPIDAAKKVLPENPGLAVFLLVFLSLSSPAFPKPVTGMDEPGESDPLKQYFWVSAKGTSYETAKEHAEKAQKVFQITRTHEAALPNGWKIAPAGQSLDLGTMPGEAVFYAGRLVVLNNGFYPPKQNAQVSVVNVRKQLVEKNIPFHSLFPCARVGPDGDLYISGGYDFKVYRLTRRFEPAPGHAEYPVGGYAGGMAFVDKNLLALTYLMVNDHGTGPWKKGMIALLDTVTGKILDEKETGHFPYALAWVGGKLYATIEGENRVQVYTLEDGKLKEGASIPVGVNPTNLTVDGTSLYVADTSSDEVSVIDTQKDQVLSTINLKQADFKYGAAPTGVAVEKDRVYVSLAGWNAVAVLDKSQGTILGLIPTGWYPTRVYSGKNDLYVLSAKGIMERRATSMEKAVPGLRKEDPAYILNLLTGTLALVSEAEIGTHLEDWTKQVKTGSPLESPAEGFKLPIKHIFYIIRENRTYDQILGDLKPGNGDAQLCLYPEAKSPNAHGISREFVTLDNFFANGEISALGHSFTTSGYASPFLEWIANIGYAGRFDWKDPDDAKSPVKYLYPYGTMPAVYSPQYLWDDLDAKDVDYKIYGEPYYLYTKPYRILLQTLGADNALVKKYYDHTLKFANYKDRGLGFTRRFSAFYQRALTPADALNLLGDPKFLSSLSQYYVEDESLAGAISQNQALKAQFADFLRKYSFNYAAWNLEVSDLERVGVWKEDFKRQRDRHQVPALEYFWLPNDHMGWPPPPTPDQYIAQNDTALGEILETLSKSDVWKDSLVLVEEDDAQDGLDHVDSTRTVALAAGPYVKRGAVVSAQYDQLGMMRTIELILGLAPLNSGDALAVPMMDIFTDRPDFKPYQAPPPSKDLMDSDQKLYRQVRGSNN
jgi:YVTN family beta-propeller protein